jgi:hypothetical protein
MLLPASLAAVWLLTSSSVSAMPAAHGSAMRSVHAAIATHANSTRFTQWLTAYGRAWSAREPEAMVKLFAQDATYREDPFAPATAGRAAIRADWVDIAQHQEDVHFNFEVLSETSRRGIAHWTASFVRRPSKEVVQLDGILIANFNAAGECSEFHEWWLRRSRKEKHS